ncbi:hypothetical protein GW17_00021606 [Ensete ventricosum]|nr:hypothetical protein GW17_00021606 [Ensete ventricosum]
MISRHGIVGLAVTSTLSLCPSPLFLHCATVASFVVAVTAPCGRQLPCQGAATLAAAALAGGRAGRYRLTFCGLAPGGRPLRHGRGRHNRPFLAVAPAALAAAGCPCKGCGCDRPPLQRAWPWPVAPFPYCFCCENTARTCRTVLRNVMSSHAV